MQSFFDTSLRGRRIDKGIKRSRARPQLFWNRFGTLTLKKNYCLAREAQQLRKILIIQEKSLFFSLFFDARLHLRLHPHLRHLHHNLRQNRRHLLVYHK